MAKLSSPVALSCLLLASVAGAAASSRPARHVGGLLPAFQLSRRVGSATAGRANPISTCMAAEKGGSGAAPQKFAIIGHNIAYSVSPAMHNAAYAELGLPHTYGLIDEESVDTIVASDFWADPAFRGMSVTIPHKQSIMPHLDELSDAAERIGAVNTVIVDRKAPGGGRTLRGDNTDWIGIYNPLKARLGDASGGAALILGAGGTARAAAYAAAQLGLERIYYNRTPSKAQELADAFGGTVVGDLSGPSDGGGDKTLGDVCEEKDWKVRVVLSTLPAAAGFELPEWLAADKSTVVFDVNYKPYWTPLLRQAEAAGLDVVRGSEMLWEQGVGQFELWLDLDAPYDVMKKVVLENCLPKDDEK
jgi:pentafunctional AROM polypeptide